MQLPGQWDLHLESIEVNQWLTGVVDSHKPAFEQANLNLSFLPMAQPVVIQGDEQRLQQVMRNILVNSLRYTDAPGRVVVSVTKGAAGIVICVKDSAPSVPATSFATFV